jgi:beta-fructofuranosidase
MLERQENWVWDSWYVVEGEELHAFYLMAPKSLGNPDLRHINARVGHSVSLDAKNWTHLPEVFGPSEQGFDDQAIWTGSVIRYGEKWHLFYTGINRVTKERVQKIGHATSDDLRNWLRVVSEPLLSAAPPYATLTNSEDGAEHFRDPWVFELAGEWQMLLTANEPSGWATIAHATSHDLAQWTLKEPLVTESQIGQFEVTQTINIDGQWVLVFCANERDIRRAGVRGGFGTYSVPAAGPLGPFDLDKTHLFAEGIYAARAVNFQNKWILLGFMDDGIPGSFSGVICDPLELRLTVDGNLEVS